MSKHVEMGVPMAELIRKIEITEQTYHRWKAEYAGLESIMSGRLSNYSTVHCFHILAYNPAVLFQRLFSLNGYPFLPSNFVSPMIKDVIIRESSLFENGRWLPWN